jgi:pimeloyl-ACP methyl ester carboxylesterase
MAQTNLGNQKIYSIKQGNHGLPMIFVHGAGSNHLVWGAQMRALSSIAQALVMDLPGHGKSGLPGRNSIEGYSDVILGMVDALGWERVVVVGHSMGGAITQLFALSHPDRVAGLGLIGTGARLRVLPVVFDGLENDFDTTVRLVVENSYAQPMDENIRRLAEEQMRACPVDVIRDDFLACNQFDVMARVSEIRVPTLIIGGGEDRMTPVKYSEYLHTKIPNSRLELIDGAGHSVMIERADVVNRALVDFVSHLSRS